MLLLFRILSVNTKAAINIGQTVGVKMAEAGIAGSIVNVSSQAGMVALGTHLAYCASKGALDQATRCMALELGPKNVRQNGFFCQRQEKFR